MVSLPWEIIVDVLCRLTVKDLLRYRSVCKLWYSRIDGPDFIKMHLHRSIETNSNNGVVLRRSNLISYSDVLYWVNSDTLDSAVRLKPPICEREPINVVGSCNGLLALINRNGDIAFWNPSTRSYRTLNKPGKYPFMMGFVTIMISFGPIVYGGSPQIQVELYSLKANTWKIINGFPKLLRYRSGNSVFLSNALHWYVSMTLDSFLAFDLVTEEFKWLPLPDYFDSNPFINRMELVELGGWLCLGICDSSRFSDVAGYPLDFWVMKEYGVKESWTKLFAVSPSNVTGSFSTLTPVVYLKSSDQVLLAGSGEFLLFDIKRKRAKRVTISDLHKGIFKIVFCVGSLVGFDGNYREVNTVNQTEEDRNKRKEEEAATE